MSNQRISMLFTDLEGSTRLWEQHGSDMMEALELHDSLVQSCVHGSGGRIVKHTGDGAFAVFSQPTEAVSAAVRFQRGLPNLDWPDPPGRLHARVGIHSGEVLELGSDVFGPAVNRAARVMHAAWPDQIVVSNATAEASEGEFNFEDLGTHYLKGLTRSMHLFQVVADGVGSVFPVLRTLSGFPNNLPSQLPSMFGRDGLVEEVLDELATHAVVTLTGPGGMGKTRLALEVAAHAGEHNRDGVWVVELAPLDKAETVAVTAAGVLRVPDRPGRSALDRIAQQLVDYQTLIVLDNCEHVAEAAAEVAATMTGAGNEVRVLATSREPLWIAGERAHAVPPLGAGGIDSPSVTLFVERAKAVRPTFDPDEADLAAISRICERLDGLPLAMELAAARVRAMSVAQLESRLDDRFRVLTVGRRDSGARHDALQTAIAWSYELLTEEQARFFAELSVFAGRAALPSVETVLQDPDAIDHLTELTDKSLVRVTDADDGSYRYSMFESIRLYAEDKLVQTGGRDELRGRHLTFCAQSAMDIGRRLDGREQRTLLPRVAELLPDLRGAMTAAVDLGRHGDGATIAAGLYRYWYLRAVREGRDWLEVFYGQRAKLEPPLRARVLYSLGSLLQVMGEYARSAEILDESVTLYRQLDNPRGLAYAMHYLARSQWGLRPFPELMQLFEESTEIFVDVGDKVGEGLGHLLQSVLLAETGDIPGAFKHAAEFRRLADEVGAPQLLAHQREFEGSVMRLDGRVDESIPLLLEGLRHYQVLANPACSAHCMENAAAAVAHFDPQGAATILAATQRLRADIGVPSPPYEQLYYDDTLTKVTMVLEDEELDAAWKAGEALDFTEALERTAEALEAVGRDRQPPSIAS